MPAPKPAGSKRKRDRYSRLICLACRQRRIRCDLPSEIEIPPSGEVRTVQTPCRRCKRLDIPCVVRQTILGRPSPEGCSPTAADVSPTTSGDIVSRIVIELSPLPGASQANVSHETQVVNSSIIQRTSLRSSKGPLPHQKSPTLRNEDVLLIHMPQSAETVIIIRALDTLRHERVEEEWFRHLPAHVGHTQALDLSIKAIVAASAHSRGVAKLTSGDCYQALALALNAVQANINQSGGRPDDDILASTALLIPFNGAIKKHGIPTRLHVEGLAAILTARSATYPVTQLARDIVDFYARETAIMACIHDTPSPFEKIDRAYFVNNSNGHSISDQAQLKALSNELFIRIPRLVKLVRALRLLPYPQNQLLLDASRLSKSLLELQDPQAEERLLQTVRIHPSSNSDATSPLRQSWPFASVQDFEALAFYWQSRLTLLRLEWRLHDLAFNGTYGPDLFPWPNCGPTSNEMFQLAKNLLMCSGYVKTLPLFKHVRLFAHAMVVVWGVMMDFPQAFNNDQNGERTDPWSCRLLRGVSTALKMKSSLTVEDMDTAADIFVGGQPKGRFAECYGL